MVRTPPAEVKRRYEETAAAVSAPAGCHRFFPALRFRPPPLRFRPPARLRGTLPPARRASLSPMAIACLRLVTFFPDRPERSVPCLRSCMARFTLLCAFLPYLAI